MEKTKLITHIDEHTVPIHIDTHGNLYLEYNNNLFQLNVDRNNEPLFETGDYSVVSDHSDIPIVRGNITKSEKFVSDKYFIEENGHTLIKKEVNKSDEYTVDTFGDDNFTDSNFEFYEMGVNVDIKERENGDINALYDTFIYDDSDTESYSKLIFQTKIPNEICIYRTIIYTSGKFYFRPIGCVIEHKYKISIENDNIVCKRI